jgi:hypothetical protein
VLAHLDRSRDQSRLPFIDCRMRECGRSLLQIVAQNLKLAANIDHICAIVTPGVYEINLFLLRDYSVWLKYLCQHAPNV